MVNRGKGDFGTIVKLKLPTSKLNVMTFVIDRKDLNDDDKSFLKKFGYGVTRRIPKYLKVTANSDFKSIVPVVW